MANSYLSRTPSGAGSRVKWTYSVWLKRSKLGHQPIWAASTDSNNYDEFYFNSSDKIQFSTVTSSTQKAIRTSRVFRDTSAWYHIVLVYDTGNSTDTDHAQLWINGVRETSFEDTTLLASGANNVQSNWNNTIEMKIGRVTTNTAAYFEGYMSHAAFVNDAVVAPTSFGETDSTSGIWKFKSPSGITWGTNGFHLKFENSGNLGLDSSGLGNNFTTNGNLKQSLSTPSNIYQSLNPNSTDSGVTLTNGCTTAGFDGSVGNAKGQFAVTKGKWYFECKITAQTNYPMIGIGEINRNQMEKRTGGSYPGGFQDSYGVYGNGNVYANGSNTGSQSFTYATNDIISVIIDLDSATKTIKWNKNGTQIATTNITNAGDDFAYAPMDYNGGENGVICNYNFGEGRFGTTDIASAGSNGNGSLFEYDVPSGHYAINTKNINTYG